MICLLMCFGLLNKVCVDGYMVDVGVCFSLINGQESGRRLHAHEAWNMTPRIPTRSAMMRLVQ